MRLHCSATLPGSTVAIAKVQNDGSWWLLNDGTDDVTLASNKELFGFNVGSFNEVPAGQFFSPCVVFNNIQNVALFPDLLPVMSWYPPPCRRSGVLDRPNPLARAVRSRCGLPVPAEWLSCGENTRDCRGHSVQHHEDPGSHRGMHAGP